MGLPGQPVLSGYREGEARGGGIACLSEAYAIKVLIRSTCVYKHPDWSAKSSNPREVLMSGVSLAGY